MDRLAFDLERVAIGVWYDKWEIRVGDSIIDKISEGLKTNDYLVLVLSPDSIRSEWVKHELSAGLMRELTEKKVVVLPVLLRDCEIPILLREKKWADFRTSYEKGFEELILAIFPESPSSVLTSRDFRSVQNLLAGLSSTDECGTNTLNATQLRQVYRFRNQLKGFLGPEEKRLLFWSAAAFGRANRHTPFFLPVTVPVWGLLDDVSDEQCAKWIVDGLLGPLCDYLIPHYEWARSVIGPTQDDAVRLAFVMRTESEDPLINTTPAPPEVLRCFIRAMAVEHPAFFREHLLSRISEDKPLVPAIIEASSYLEQPPESSFYLSLLDSRIEKRVAAYQALVKLDSPQAVLALKSCVKHGDLNRPQVDHLFNQLRSPSFGPLLREWFNESKRHKTRTRIMVALVNCGAADITDAMDLLRTIESQPKLFFDMVPTVLRVLGRLGTQSEVDSLVFHLNPEVPVNCEAALFSLGRLLGAGCLPLVKPLLVSTSATVVASGIEVLQRYAPSECLSLVAGFGDHPSPLVRSVFYRAIAVLKPSNWEALLEQGLKDRHSLVRLSAARAFAKAAPADMLLSWLDDQSRDLVARVTADQMLYSRPPFRPNWTNPEESFDERLARLPVRITNIDPDIVVLSTALDLDRMVDIQVMGQDD